MAFGGLIEGRSDNFGVHAALHVGDFLGSFVDEENHYIGFRMVFGNSIGDVFEKKGLTCLRGSYN